MNKEIKTSAKLNDSEIKNVSGGFWGSAPDNLSPIPFSEMIGGPLKASIEAQARTAKSSWEFIKEVGISK